MKKIYTIILALIAISGGFYALVRFAGLDPSEFLAGKPKAETRAASPEQMAVLYDSLENLNFTIRKETDERRLKNLKDLQKNLWERILSGRNSLKQKEEPQADAENIDGLVDSLIKGISVTAAILLAVIIILLVKINRRSKEVEKVTEKLKNLQAEPPPPPPLGGIDPTVFQTRIRPPLPQVKPMGESTSAPQTQSTPTLRPTARQRVTEAVKRMAEALESLRTGKTIKTKAVPTQPVAAVVPPIRVPSPNSTRIVPPGDETTFDRRAREKKQILDYAKQGRTPSEIAKWLALPRDQVETVIRLARERGE